MMEGFIIDGVNYSYELRGSYFVALNRRTGKGELRNQLSVITHVPVRGMMSRPVNPKSHKIVCS